MKRNASMPALFLVLALSLSLPAAAVAADELESAVNAGGAYLLETVQAPQVGSVGGEWALLGLARSGCPVPEAYWTDYYAGVEEYVTACGGVLHEKKYTEYSRLIVSLTAIGGDPTDVAGYDLLTALGDYDKTVWQGLNGPIWALIALDSGSYDMPQNPAAATQATRQMYVERILSCQLPDGGWSLFGGTSSATAGDASADPNITGMALQALAKYLDQAAVNEAVEEALVCMSLRQDETGGFAGTEGSSLESNVQMLVGLCELGLELDDARFVKNGRTVLDAVLDYRQPDGSFIHAQSGSGSNLMASEQGLYGLSAALRAAQGKSSLYRMDDVAPRSFGAADGGNAPAGGVQKQPIVAAGATFADVAGHPDQTAIEAMAARGILGGRGDGLFDPDATMTRAEFAAVAVRALGLAQKSAAFGDVPADSWYAPYVGAAQSAGILTGKGDGSFDPEGLITRQEASVMVTRAAALCGLDTAVGEREARDLLAQFGDYTSVSGWAREQTAFCYREGILDEAALNVEPARAITRCEVAQMVYHLLDAAALL